VLVELRVRDFAVTAMLGGAGDSILPRWNASDLLQRAEQWKKSARRSKTQRVATA